VADEDARAAVVTGGASGIGRVVVERLCRDGWRVASLDITDTPEPERALRLVADVRDPSAVNDALHTAADQLGPVSLYVHCAAIAPRAEPCTELSVADFHEVLEVDLVGSFVLARAAANLLRTQGGGAIVLVSSAAGLRARPGLAAYGAAKAGVIQLTKVMAAELAPLGIRVNCVSPGVTLTPLMLRSWGTTDPREAFRRADAQAPIPLGRLVTADEVADAILYLGECPGAITGHNLVVDGGRSL
jgi:NAD(P)-dependent dehydrogenase (short-subunit alcohol dehydrogenase family)